MTSSVSVVDNLTEETHTSGTTVVESVPPLWKGGGVPLVRR